ncbi:CubicO group peptidase (beta-lactamase class C family) [Thermocatellispora tengchongensis]|uniref:CubicO group peptidase (Beta-lactamase class C family) n=1 Tax=Thermocatellispora tengchongensis TaxID=1073253 RepID=A0A840PGL3_9ACTN|nr:serine hydrolase domain-containing protein [Thermocatellispora tengchongensis]MBB5138119.1 CubicO group peptidase (beta-lactamase class C family) [Thermocatellispora tengchongensis]
MLNRRDVLKAALVAPIGIAVGRPALASSAEPWEAVVARGNVPSALIPFDVAMKKFMYARGITAGQLAIARKGKLVFTRGYTLSTAATPVPGVAPTSLFRIASLSKHITATAILRLAQEGRLNLGTPVTSLLDLKPMAGKTADARLANVTMWRLMQHSGGWDKAISGDPTFADRKIATTLGTDLPSSHADMMTYMTSLPLDFTPGSKYVYSNYGYMLLGRVIEEITGMSYGSYVTSKLLTPLGITRMWLGRTLKADTAREVPYESRYTATTVLDESGATVPYPYGGFNMANLDATGGWVATAMDLVRFQRVFDTPSSVNLLSSLSISRAFAKPEWGTFSSGSWYGGGWYVRSANGGLNTWHNGSLPGTYTFLGRRYDGITYAAFFNRRGENDGLPDFADIDPILYDVADQITTWPSVDYSSIYF